MNEYTIKLIDGKQLPYRPIYTYSLVELETLKVYIKTYLETRFIQTFKSPVNASILFNKKSNNNFYLNIKY